MTLFVESRVERTGFDGQGNATFRIIQASAPSEWIRPAQLARTLGFNVRTIYTWIDSGLIRHDEYRRPGAGHVILISAGVVARLRDRKKV
jgi:hypothetical protein